jgi:hypothetical protein
MPGGSHTICSPVQFRNLTGPTSPFNKVGVVKDFYGYAQVLDYSFRDKVKSGEVNWRVGSIDSLESDGAVLSHWSSS